MRLPRRARPQDRRARRRVGCPPFGSISLRSRVTTSSRCRSDLVVTTRNGPVSFGGVPFSSAFPARGLLALVRSLRAFSDFFSALETSCVSRSNPPPIGPNTSQMRVNKRHWSPKARSMHCSNMTRPRTQVPTSLGI
jgi:hypothetical protein